MHFQGFFHAQKTLGSVQRSLGPLSWWGGGSLPLPKNLTPCNRSSTSISALQASVRASQLQFSAYAYVYVHYTL